MAKNIVAAGLAKRCEIQFAYAIGYPDPVSVYVDTFGTGTVPTRQIERRGQARVQLSSRPTSSSSSTCCGPIYSKTTNYGHFGKDDPDITWERTDKVAALEPSQNKPPN